MNAILKEYKELEAINDHCAAAVLLAKTFGSKEETETMERIKEAVDNRGHILQHEIQEQSQISRKYYPLLKRLN